MGIELLLEELKSYGDQKGTTLDKAIDFWQDITCDIKENAAGAVGILNE